MRILIIEDEYNLADAIATSLNLENYQTKIVTNGDEGLDEAISGLYDLILLDVMLPGKDGWEILKEIKDFQPEAKVIMLTARSEVDDRVKGLRGGADDYVTKPFHMEELIARVDVQLNRASKEAQNRLTFNDLELHLNNSMLYCTESKEEIRLSIKEFAILEYMFQNQNQILSKEQIYNKVWGWDNDIESNNLEAYVSFLRKKLKTLKSRSQIKAVRGLGYRLEKNEL